MNTFKPLLNVYLIWHPAAEAMCQPLAQAIFTLINRNSNQPFARSISIPTYFRCVPAAGQTVPIPIDLDKAEQSVIFVLVEDHIVFEEAWGQYAAELYAQTQTSPGRHLLVPIALSGSAFNLHPDIAKANFVRLFNLDADSLKTKLCHSVLHILARQLKNTVRQTGQGLKLSPAPVKLFISHTKREAQALALATALKQAIDNTQLDRFFDAMDIASGFRFDQEIDANINDAALIAIHSDRYTDSPWCRVEVMQAKRMDCPIIVVDALQQQELRRFPYLSNVPGIRFDLNQDLSTPASQQQLQAIIDFALLEVLRFTYSQQYLQHLTQLGWLPDNATLLARPPEEQDLIAELTQQQVIYPDPPLGYEEYQALRSYNKTLDTPTTLRGKTLQTISIGISISDPDPGELNALGLSDSHLKIAMLEIARQCLVQGAQLVFGGDLRKGGFTEDLLELVRYHNDTIHDRFPPARNYLAWPLKDTLEVTWAAQNKDAIKIISQTPPVDLINQGLIPTGNAPINPNSVSSYVWARCLTAMRQSLVDDTHARIMMGGKTTGFKGKYPGLLEEALLVFQAQKPLYLLGGFGGASRAIGLALLGQQPEALTEAYQCRNKSYAELLKSYNDSAASHPELEAIDYLAINKTLATLGFEGLNNGLNTEENLALFNTVNIDEAVGLIMQGLANLDRVRK